MDYSRRLPFRLMLPHSVFQTPNSPMPTNVYIFECSTATYLDCVQRGIFGSNLPWPRQIRKGDHCCLYHYEVGTLFGLWRAVADGGKNLVQKAWRGRFPFQVKVALVT